MANDMINFFTTMMSHVATWLNTEPIKYFTAIFLGAAIIGLVAKIWKINRL